MDLSLFQNLGISEKASKIYVTALSLGTASVQDLAQKSGLKRPTTYLHVDELLSQGLLTKLPIGKKEYFIAVDPSLLEQRASQHLSLIKQAIPNLKHLQETAQGKPHITILEGEKGIKQIYNEIRHANSIRFWGHLSKIETTFSSSVKNIARSINKEKITSHEIINDDSESRRASRRYADTAGATYSSRLATIQGIENDNAIYNNIAALFRIEGVNLYVIRIEDPTIVNSMKSLFDMAWHSAKPFIGK